MYYNTELLERWEDELSAMLDEAMAKAVANTARKRNPIIFCSDECKQKYFSDVVCVTCGGDECTTKPFPNIDALYRVGSSVERVHWQKERDDILRDASNDWQLKGSCTSCGGSMMPRSLDVLRARLSCLRTTCMV